MQETFSQSEKINTPVSSCGNASNSPCGKTPVSNSPASNAPASSPDRSFVHTFNNVPIGVFDSGFGGLTVVREIMKELPQESIIYLGDSARCPYGPRQLSEVDTFVQQIGKWLLARKVKMIVIACNTATAAGLMHLQQTLPIPVIGVVEPGARAAVHATRNRRVGVIATKATVASNAYTEAIRHIDAGITVFSTAAPRFVEIAEQGIRMAQGPIESYTSLASKVYIRPAFQEIAREYLEPLRRCNIDTLVLGCTHYPLLKALIGSIIGRDVTLISSAREVARDVAEILGRKGALAGVSKNSAEQISVESTSEQPTQEKQLRDDTKACEQGLSEQPSYKFFTTGNDIESFRNFGARVLRCELQSVEQINLS